MAQKSVVNPTPKMAPDETNFSCEASANVQLSLDEQPSTSKSTTVEKEASKSGEPNKFDVAHYRERVRGMSSSEIFNLIKNVFKPEKNYTFPKSSGRSFRHEWLN